MILVVIRKKSFLTEILYKIWFKKTLSSDVIIYYTKIEFF